VSSYYHPKPLYVCPPSNTTFQHIGNCASNHSGESLREIRKEKQIKRDRKGARDGGREE
jgi:hypothetical protein